MMLLTDIGRLWLGTGEVLTDAAVLVRDGRIAWFGPRREAPVGGDDVVSCEGALLTPGLVDAHAHPVYAGHRFDEITQRAAGAGYAEIAVAGGGIAATVRATRAAGEQDLAAAVRGRLRSWLRGGTTTVECKTGYHLTADGELAQVRLLAGLRDEPGGRVARPYVTFLPAHAVPPEYAGRQDEYARQCALWAAAAAEAGADGVDAFCDEGYFTVEQTRDVLRAGAAAGLVPRVHADELARTGGALLAAELGAASADHLLRATAEDARALAAAGVAATLCPLTGLQLRTQPPARTLLDAGVTVALGTDHNPGQCGSTSMALVVAVAVAALGMTVAEALTAATAGSAAALRLTDRGVIRQGAAADLVLWDADHEGAFAWAFGLAPRRVWLAGEPVEEGE